MLGEIGRRTIIVRIIPTQILKWNLQSCCYFYSRSGTITAASAQRQCKVTSTGQANTHIFCTVYWIHYSLLSISILPPEDLFGITNQ